MFTVANFHMCKQFILQSFLTDFSQYALCIIISPFDRVIREPDYFRSMTPIKFPLRSVQYVLVFKLKLFYLCMVNTRVK